MDYPEIGSKLGKFELLSVIGEGTTSRVYRSYNKYFKKDVVIKVLSLNLVIKNPNLRICLKTKKGAFKNEIIG